MMDVAFDLGTLLDSECVRLDVATLRRFNPRRSPIISNVIDEMGKFSSQAQGIKRGVLTSYEKMMDADYEQFLYILWQPHATKVGHSAVIGLLKVGYRNLYLYDKTGRCHQCKPLCILDFYVYDSLQRKGYGRRMFDYMLSRESACAAQVAIDKPSNSLLCFMKKHFGLAEPVWQQTHYAVYPEFFKILDDPKWRPPSTAVQSASVVSTVPAGVNAAAVAAGQGHTPAVVYHAMPLPRAVAPPYSPMGAVTAAPIEVDSLNGDEQHAYAAQQRYGRPRTALSVTSGSATPSSPFSPQSRRGGGAGSAFEPAAGTTWSMEPREAARHIRMHQQQGHGQAHTAMAHGAWMAAAGDTAASSPFGGGGGVGGRQEQRMSQSITGCVRGGVGKYNVAGGGGSALQQSSPFATVESSPIAGRRSGEAHDRLVSTFTHQQIW